MIGLKSALLSGVRPGPSATRGLQLATGQAMDARSVRRVRIEPAVGGRDIWDLDLHGPLNLGVAGSWVITPMTTFAVRAKLWGGGGYIYVGQGLGQGGGGGKVAGLLTLRRGKRYVLAVAAAGVSQPYSSTGGGMSSIRLKDAECLMVAGGGGGGAGGGGTGAASGLPSPGLGTSPATAGLDGGNGTQVEGGQAGIAGGVGQPGAPGAKFLGGARVYGGGGGDGWFGGGSGALYSDGGGTTTFGGGGGGSCYLHPIVDKGQVWAGSGTQPGDNSDPDRNTAGDGGYSGLAAGAGRLILS